MVWKIWTKIYCSARNLLVHHSSLSHTTYVETNNSAWQQDRERLAGYLPVVEKVSGKGNELSCWLPSVG